MYLASDKCKGCNIKSIVQLNKNSYIIGILYFKTYNFSICYFSIKIDKSVLNL